MLKKTVAALVGLAGIDLYRRHKRLLKVEKAREVEGAAALLATGKVAGVAKDVVIIYHDEALCMKTMIPAADTRYRPLKQFIEGKWKYVSQMSNGVTIYEKPV